MKIKLSSLLGLFLFLNSTIIGSCEEEKITWTPNEDAENAPLPLSMNQRKQLLQLEQAIRSSPDPNGTLEQVAQQNGMSPQDLVNMLEKNARDLSQDPSLLQPKTVVSVISKALATIGLVISQAAKKHPRSFTLSLSLLLLILYAKVMIPRTGLHVTQRTALFPPSQKYLQKLADYPRLEHRPLSIKSQKMKWDDLMLENDGVEVHKLSRSSELSQAVSAQISLVPEDLFEVDLEEENALDVMKEVLGLLFENAAYVLSERQWTEFAPTNRPLKSADSGKKHGVLMVPSLGSFGRCGIIRWQITQRIETDKVAGVTFATLKGNSFDGQIHLEARMRKSRVVIVAHLGVPKKRGRKIKKSVARKIVNDFVESLATSTSQRTRQNLARRSVGKRFKVASSQRASERRKSRSDREREIEEMSKERRRRWQRGNPDAGRWRPSGDRMRSPDGGPSRSW